MFTTIETTPTSTERRRPHLHPPTADAEYLPINLNEAVKEAINTTSPTVDGHAFDPTGFEPPAGWTQSNEKGHSSKPTPHDHERVRWTHPFYDTITVESRPGENTYRAWGADNSPFHTGSRHVTYIRAAQHIAECDSPPAIGILGEQLTKEAQRYGRLTNKVDRMKPIIDRWAKSFPLQSITDAIENHLRKQNHYYLADELDQYAAAVARKWPDEIGR